VKACVESREDGAWLDFVDRFHHLIAATVIKTARRFGPTPTELIDDLIQDTYLRVCADHCRALRNLRDPNAVFGLVQSIAYSVVQDHFRSQGAEKRGAKAKKPTTPRANHFGIPTISIEMS
jgi:RNA polymerase sigma-70 factor (ECF subfamily)